MSRYYDRSGKPLSDVKAWANLLEDKGKKYRRVKEDYTPQKKYWVSTVWLGLDHSFGGGKPLIFETMVFRNTSVGLDMSDLDMNRYTTEKQALAGHKAMLAKWTAKEAK